MPFVGGGGRFTALIVPVHLREQNVRRPSFLLRLTSVAARVNSFPHASHVTSTFVITGLHHQCLHISDGGARIGGVGSRTRVRKPVPHKHLRV
jgi:hypothetical protein